MKLEEHEWKLDHLHLHLQAAVELEFWTIPFYMSAMYSIKDRSAAAYQLIRTVINQEMLHLQSAANIANAYGLSPIVPPPVYEGQQIPHLDFDLDDPSVIDEYRPYTAEIGPLDLEHVNAMCLVEIPNYEASQRNVAVHSRIEEYGSIGAFYRALRRLALARQRDVRGGVRQVDYFAPFYRNTPSLTVTDDGSLGFRQVELLIDLITNQGEGECKKKPIVPAYFQNTADDQAPVDDHFAKFSQIKSDAKNLPDTFSAKQPCDYTEEDRRLARLVLDQFTSLRQLLEQLFRGESPAQFFPRMAAVGGAIRNCWQHGVTPIYADPEGNESGRAS